MSNPSSRRLRTVEVVQSLGLPYVDSVPELDAPKPTRARDDALHRLLAMYCAIAVYHGRTSEEVIRWAEVFGCEGHFTPLERGFVHVRAGSGYEINQGVDAMWSIASALSLVDGIGPLETCPETFASIFPLGPDDVRYADLNASATFRDNDQLLDTLDLTRCVEAGMRSLHTVESVTEFDIQIRSLSYYRWLGMEWLYSSDDWNAVQLRIE